MINSYHKTYIITLRVSCTNFVFSNRNNTLFYSKYDSVNYFGIFDVTHSWSNNKIVDLLKFLLFRIRRNYYKRWLVITNHIIMLGIFISLYYIFMKHRGEKKSFFIRKEKFVSPMKPRSIMISETRIIISDSSSR